MPLHPDPQQLLQAFVDFVHATSWPQSKRVLEQHPELLGDEVDALVGQLAAAQESKEAHDLVEAHRALLQRCRSVGVEVTFAETEGASPGVVLAELQEEFSLAQDSEQMYQSTRQESALDAAISAWERILSHAAFAETAAAFQRAVFNDAGCTYLRRYWAKGELPDLDRSLALWQQALAATPADAPDRAMYLNNLGNGLRDRYARSGRLEDLEQAIEASQQAMDATPTDAPERVAILNSLGNGLRDRYARSGRLEDLEQAIEAFQQAVDATPTDAPDRAIYLNNLGNGLRDRYARSGQLADLEAAIEALQDAVAATPANAPNRALYLNSLGGGLRDRYARSGQLADLEAAIEALRDAVAATPANAPNRAMYLNNLGLELRERYRRSGQLADLEAAIEALQDAVAATPANAPNRAMYLNNLGLVLHDRYARSGQLADLEAAIEALHDAVAATPANAPDNRARHLNNLGNGLHNRYARSRQLADLEAAIKAYRQALAATPTDAPNRALYLNSLGNGLRDRYARSRQLADLEAAIKAYRQALAATPTDAPNRAMYLDSLGNGLHDRYARSGQLADLEAAQSAYRDACEAGLETALESALIAARGWGNWAFERHAWEEVGKSYGYGVKAVERLLEVQLLRSAKETWLREVLGLAANAAYALARIGDLKRAVEVIEGGRARLLAEALERSRHDLEQLPAQGYGELLARYRQAAARWAALTAEMERPSEAPLPDAAPRRAALAEGRAELDAVVQAVRQVPGYDDFLRASTFRHIRAAARDVPLVYLMATSAGGLALVIPAAAEHTRHPDASDEPAALWLNTLTAAAVREQLWGAEDTQELGGYLGAYARWRAEPHNPETRAHWFDTLETTTRWLWEALMGPLIAALTPTAVPQAPSVPPLVLVPTGLLGLLPLHAAWTEDLAAPTGRRYALDVAVLRYAPNARALIAAEVLAETTHIERLLLCVEPQPVSASSLPAAAQEALEILRYWPLGSYTDRWHMTVTHEALVTQLPGHTCLHFIGHAFAGWDEPQQGGLLLASNHTLTVRELTGMRLPLRLAILSACETGVPGTRLPDEVIGLPTALMESGVAGVVASFWSVADDSTARLMTHFHRLWRQAELAAPEALRRAQIQLRNEGYAHPFYWGAFAYTGL